MTTALSLSAKVQAHIFGDLKKDCTSADINRAGFLLGHAVSGSILDRDRALSLLEIHRGLKCGGRHADAAYAGFEAGLAEGANRERALAEIFGAAANDNDDIPILDAPDLDGQPIPERQWLVDGLIPLATVTLLSGEGGTGKSLLALQLAAAMALKTDWIGQPVRHCGNSIFFTAEDDTDELTRRIGSVVNANGTSAIHLEGMRIIPMAGRDAVLAAPNQQRRLAVTPLFEKLKRQVLHWEPELLVLDTSADVFGGDEINRAQVREFIGLLRGLALESQCAVLLLSHPSVAGINSGTGTSGSTAWSNSVRSRLYLDAPDEHDKDARRLRLMKSNYGQNGTEIKLRWHNGVFIAGTAPDAALAASFVNRKAEEIFLELLRVLTAQARNVTVTTGSSYAPAVMMKHDLAVGWRKEQLAAAMQRLLDAGRIKNESYGPPSRQRSKLVAVVDG